MKKFLFCILVLMIIFGGYLFYDIKIKTPLLDTEEEIVDIDSIYVYGTHLNMHGKMVNDTNVDLVLYDGKFIPIKINTFNNEFNLSDYTNDGLYLDNLNNGEYYLFLRSSNINDNGEYMYKYYTINNTTGYDKTIYYTFSNFNKKIIISTDNNYHTIMIDVTNNKDEDIYDIVLDPGHGGKDGGASRYGYKEADFTMKLASGVKEKLEKSGLKVKITREGNQLSNDETLPEYGNHGRAVIPHEVNAKYLFSFHMNSSNYSSVSGLEVYTANKNNLNFAKIIAKNLVKDTGIKYSSNKINMASDGIYIRTFTEDDINSSILDQQQRNMLPYDITTNTNYYYIIRETGGIVTGAYVDDRNKEIPANPYVKSNIGTEAYLLELGYISNKSDLDNMINNMDKYMNSIANSILTLYQNND